MKYCPKIRDTCSSMHDTQHAMRRASHKGFTLSEAMMALMILGLVCSSVLVVINRCVASAADSALRMHAFETARQNMEKLLACDSVKESVEYGASDRYPDIKWTSVVETFYEPIGNRMWVRAVCSAEYEDSQGETQTIKLTHWLTNVTKEQLLQIMKEQEAQDQQFLADQIVETIEEAAEYAGVKEETIEQWLENGMLTMENGAFIKNNLDIYKRNNGKPSEDDKKLQVQTETDLVQLRQQLGTTAGQPAPGQTDRQNELDPVTGLTYQELERMDFNQIFELLKKQQGKEF